ncbi:hypothetical protein GCM10011584_09100 [Nocardioides phosphati]|uniref:Class E sortase n=1 Tax=Nocardioides phosphati TaxID=1867775 RepID=A0ABQ2N7C0_9ACTN|nr:sortase [Nocardioides phosphati]GGO86538.1 hypothetical protein GCM10011584_09100 [Nocardioides phosphati]
MRRLIGVVLILAGLSGLGYIGWQFWGTDWQSARIQAQVRTETEQAWAHGKEPHVKWGTVEGIVRIPRFGDDYAIPLMEFTGYPALHAGFGHMPKSADVGHKGNFVIIAHRTTRNEPLRHMPDLRVGDQVVIETRTRVYTYRLITRGDALRVRFDTGGWVLDPLPHNPKPGGVEPPQHPGQRLITMVTCAELFHSDDRLAVFGELQRVDQKAPPA